MHPGGNPGLGPGLTHRVNQQSGGVVVQSRLSLPGSTSNNAVPRRQSSAGGKLMRLRCRFRPLHDAYIKNGVVVDDDTDVIFICGDGHHVRAHRVIMASSSKFFAKLFEDQTGETSVVNVPDIKVDIMKLILQLTYRDRVILTMNQIKQVGDFITMFGMAWSQFGFEEYSGEEPMTASPMAPIPLKPVELPRKVVYVARPSPQGGQQQVVRRVIANVNRVSAQKQIVNNDEEDYAQPTPGYGNGQENGQVEQRPSPQSHSRKSRLTPRAGTEMEDEIMEQDGEEDPETLIRDWMSKLGKRESNQGAAEGTTKKMRMDESGTEPASSPTKNICTVCKTAFQTESAWRWHEDRHVGINMFKCQFCDELSRTPKMCYIHEKEVHGFSGLQQTSSFPSAAAAANQGEQKRIVIRTNQGGKFVVVGQNQPGRVISTEAQKLSKKIKMAKLQAQKKRPAVMNFAGRHPQIGIGDSHGSELLDVKKIKQLHWLYVCARCENCSDSATKATLHYSRCYPEKEQDFEATVTKYRQGFYGKSKCPLCPRRYPQNSGFMIHCGHQHQQYRRLFTICGGADDGLKCVSCKKKFAEPLEFHEHLGTAGQGAFQCGADMKVEEEKEKEVVKSSRSSSGSSAGKPERQPRPRRPESPIESKASYKVQFHTPPRSARLASRAQAEAVAETASKSKATELNYPPLDCPVCGDSDLPNISLHLQSKHKDLNVEVNRISSDLLRCKGCTITFNICDLLDHKDCMLATVAEKEKGAAAVQLQEEPPRLLIKPGPKTSLVVDFDSLPPGVGRSPIERIEIDDLHSIQAIRTALKCLICGNTAKKLGIIADCLRAHGIHRCALCFNSYVNKADYALHLKKCHGMGSKLKCPLCPKAFANAGQTSGHMYSTHWLQILKANEVGGLEDSKASEDDAAAAADNNVETVEAEPDNNSEHPSITNSPAGENEEEAPQPEEDDKESKDNDDFPLADSSMDVEPQAIQDIEESDKEIVESSVDIVEGVKEEEENGDIEKSNIKEDEEDVDVV
ncbi:Zinc finger and BTB domain-containing protein 24 [Orchesella cincta]|uniref:Zinc finger and BTB domain-containing protein 24 n=1 Tax=Orchesella cincta TaxID=48709 RepID=A0A1D2MSS4_ORCCI|nr:Zinc finger and BTB domain-containing protein 24 [Orchesella cincta]